MKSSCVSAFIPVFPIFKCYPIKAPGSFPDLCYCLGTHSLFVSDTSQGPCCTQCTEHGIKAGISCRKVTVQCRLRHCGTPSLEPLCSGSHASALRARPKQMHPRGVYVVTKVHAMLTGKPQTDTFPESS